MSMNSTNGSNREYRDRLFKFIFGNPENKEWTLSLYNAVNNSHYTDADAIKFNTIDDAVYMSMKNDVSFLIYNTVSMYEQQSTFNPNVPMRFFIYGGMIYSKYIEESCYHKYSSVQQKAPTPKCICFYNGSAEKEDRKILRLSDSFDGESDIEVKVTMININYGHNRKLLEACKPLNDYSWFVEKIRSNQSVMGTLSEAIEAAMNELPDDSVIKPFLIANKAEVKRMCITEYDEEKTFAEQRQEGIEQGRKEGIKQGIKQGIEQGIEQGILSTLISLVKDGILTLVEAAKRADMSTAEFEAKTGLKAQ